MERNAKERGLIIIGNGISGVSAARVVRKLCPELRIRILSAESKYFFSRTALMYIYMGHMRLEDTQPYETSFYSKNRLELIYDHALHIDTQGKQVHTENGSVLSYDMLLLATGSHYNTFGWPGENLPGVQGLYSLQDLEKLERNTRTGRVRRAVIVGGGLIGIELAEMLHTRSIAVSFLVREASYWGKVLPKEESAMINQEILDHHIDLRLSTSLKEIQAGPDGRVAKVVTDKGEGIDCQLVGLTTGVHPNLSCLAGMDPKSKGAIKYDKGILIGRDMESNIPDIFAAGDCAQFYSSKGAPGTVEQLWYTGRRQGATAGRFIAQRACQTYKPEDMPASSSNIAALPYERGVFFNSAKFFTIEYQTYGQVPAQLDEKQSFCWQEASSKRLIRLVWKQAHGMDPKEMPVQGMNFLGTRFRHDLCERWIQEERSAAYVCDHLKEAAFDPEFSHSSCLAFQKAFRMRFALELYT